MVITRKEINEIMQLVYHTHIRANTHVYVCNAMNLEVKHE